MDLSVQLALRYDLDGTLTNRYSFLIVNKELRLSLMFTVISLKLIECLFRCPIFKSLCCVLIVLFVPFSSLCHSS